MTGIEMEGKTFISLKLKGYPCMFTHILKHISVQCPACCQRRLDICQYLEVLEEFCCDTALCFAVVVNTDALAFLNLLYIYSSKHDKMHMSAMAAHGDLNIAMQKPPINYLNFRLSLSVHFCVCLQQNIIANSGVGDLSFV